MTVQHTQHELVVLQNQVMTNEPPFVVFAPFGHHPLYVTCNEGSVSLPFPSPLCPQAAAHLMLCMLQEQALQMTPPPADFLPTDVIDSAKHWMTLAADRLAIAGAAQMDVLVHADKGEIIIVDVHTVPDLSQNSLLLQQVGFICSMQPAFSPKSLLPTSLLPVSYFKIMVEWASKQVLLLMSHYGWLCCIPCRGSCFLYVACSCLPVRAIVPLDVLLGYVMHYISCTSSHIDNTDGARMYTSTVWHP